METNELGIFVRDRQAVVSSRDVARVFEKEHKNVIRDIKGLECSEDFAALNFEPGSYRDSQNQERPEYLMTRDGFSFLAMGFTGAKAAAWKEKYITAFNQMEKTIREGTKVLMNTDVDFGTAKLIIDGARAFRDVMSKGSRRRLMLRAYGMMGIPGDEVQPKDSDHAQKFYEGRFEDVQEAVEAFIEECCCVGGRARITTREFYEAFMEWYMNREGEECSRDSVSRAVSRLNKFRRGRTASDRYWEGLGLDK